MTAVGVRIGGGKENKHKQLEKEHIPWQSKSASTDILNMSESQAENYLGNLSDAEQMKFYREIMIELF